MSIEKDPAGARRLDFVPDPVRRAEYAKRFEAREPIATLTGELELTEKHASWCLRQEVVESRPDLRLDETSAADGRPRRRPVRQPGVAGMPDRADWLPAQAVVGLTSAVVEPETLVLRESPLTSRDQSLTTRRPNR